LKGVKNLMGNKKLAFYVVIIILAIVLLSVLGSAFYTVQEDEHALVVRFQRIERVVSSPGLNFKIPIIEDVIYLPKPKLFHEITQSDVITADIKAMNADCFIIWEISDPQVFYQRLRTVAGAQARVEAITYNALKTTVSTMEQREIVGSTEEQAAQIDFDEPIEQDVGSVDIVGDERSREYLNTVVTAMAKENAEGLGIRIIDVKIKSFELPHDNEQSVFRRMISERERYATFEKAEGEREANFIRNEVDRRANITVSDARARAEEIRAEGESEYMRLLAEAYRGFEREEFYSFMRGLDVARAALVGNDKTLILDRDSLLAQILIAP